MCSSPSEIGKIQYQCLLGVVAFLKVFRRMYLVDVESKHNL